MSCITGKKGDRNYQRFHQMSSRSLGITQERLAYEYYMFTTQHGKEQLNQWKMKYNLRANALFCDIK